MFKRRFPIKKHYAWVVCAGCLLMHFCSVGMVINVLSSGAAFVRDEIGLSNTQTSTITTVRSLFTMLSMALAGRYYRKVSLRLGATIGNAFLVAGCLLFSRADSLALYYLGAILLGISYGLGSVIPIPILMRNWFCSRRSTAIAITFCGSGIASVVVPPLFTWLVTAYGLRPTYLAFAGLAALCSGVIYLVVRDTPAEMNLAPYREDGYAETRQQTQQRLDGNASRHEVLLVFFAAFLIGFSGSPSLGHQTIHYITVGHPAAQAALAVSVCGVVMTASKFLYGAATDNFGAYRVNYVYLPIWILANIATACANGTSALILFAAATLNGIGVSSGSIGISVWVGDLSPAKDYAQNIQQSQTLFSLGSLLGTSVPGIIADAIGSYAPFYVASGIISVLIMAIVQSLYRKHLVKKVCTMP